MSITKNSYLSFIRIIFASLILATCCLNQSFAETDDDEISEVRLVFTEDGQPVSGVTLYVDDDEATTNDQGKTKLEVPSGVRIVTLVRDDLDLAVLNIVVSYGEVVTIIADVQADADIPSIDIESLGVSGANAASGKGTITGQIISGTTSEPVANAKVIVLGVATEVATDAEGKFQIENVAGGTYGLTVTQNEFRSYSLDHFVVVANEPINLDIQMLPIMKANVSAPIDDIVMEEVIVTARYVADESSIAGALEAVRLSADVTELISADQIARSGASDAAAALKRVTGVNVGSNNFANIRGLPARYTKTTWNGSELPSTDPVRRTIPLDLFPADVLKSIEVQKSYSADKPGEFAGGLINLQTISLPEESYLKLSIGTGGNTETTFRRGFTYEGGDEDFFGADDGTRDLPDRIEELTAGGRKSIRITPFSVVCPDPDNVNCVSRDEFKSLDNLFDPNLNIHEKKIAPDIGFSIAGGYRWDRDWGSYGFNGAFTFDNEWQTTSGPHNNEFGYTRSTAAVGSEAVIGNFGGIVSETEEFRTSNEITLGGLFSMGIEIGEGTELTSNTFLYRKTTDVARERITETAVDVIIRESLLEWTENELFSQQFIGKHDLAAYFRTPFGFDLDWRYMESRTSRDVPDRRKIGYRNNLDNTLGFLFTESDYERSFDYTIDRVRNIGADITLNLWEDTSFSTEVKAGYSYLKQRRDTEFEVFGVDNIVNPIPTDVTQQQNPEIVVTDPIWEFDQGFAGVLGNSNGNQVVDSTYFNIEQNFFDKVKVNGGVRFESSEIDISAFSGITPVASNNTLEDYFELPGISATISITDDMQLRLGYGETVSRPNIRELTAINYEDTVLNEDFVGNPDLVATEIQSYDARWEWYFGDTENLSIAYFEKDFSNPIEIVAFLVGGDNDAFDLTFQNAEQAEAEGLEFGWRKNLGFLSGLGIFEDIFDNLFFYGNYSVIDSEVTADININPNFETLDKRPLQGQPDWLLNMAIGYEGDNTEFTILYNQVDDYINFVGNVVGGTLDEKEPDFIVESAPSLDIIFKKKFLDSFKLSFSAKNILNPENRLFQGDETITSFHKGREYSISLSWEPYN